MHSRMQGMSPVRFKKFAVALLILLSMGAMGGCSGLQAERPGMKFYSLHYEVPLSESQRQLPFIVSVEPFQGLAPYDTTRIIYSTDRFGRNRYVYHQWIAEPAEMVTQLLSRDIRNANIFRAVMTTNDPMATHLIRGTVEGFYENDNREKWDAILSVTVTFIKKDEVDIAKKICFQKNYVANQACAENNPEGLAAAMSMAMAEVSQLIITDIRAAVSCL